MKSKTDHDELWETFPTQETWEKCVKEHRYILRDWEHLSQTINDMIMSLRLWINDYPFDDNHIAKQKTMIDNACLLIGAPRTVEELAVMAGLDDEYVELARQHDKELKA